MNTKGEILIYESTDLKSLVEVRLEDESVWLSQRQMAELFGRDRVAITQHLGNIFREKELIEDSVCKDSLHTADDGKRYNTKIYNLDVIISVGYRVKSKRGTQFRQWATQRLKDHLIKGFTFNENRLKESEERFLSLKKSIQLLETVVDRKALSADEAVGLLKVVSEYAHALDLLDQYDHQRLSISEPHEPEIVRLGYEEAIDQIAAWRAAQDAGKLFGNEKDQSFKSSLEVIYQTFEGKDLYPGPKEKAANLLYFVVKNHSFTDGNKRIAAGLFVYFLDKNRLLYKADGSKILADNALVAITMMVAESDPEEKDTMIKLIVNLMTA